MSVTHRDMLFWSKRRYFASKNDRWGLEPIDTSNSDAIHYVFHAQSDRCGLGHIETYNSVPRDAVFQSKSTDEGGDP